MTKDVRYLARKWYIGVMVFMLLVGCQSNTSASTSDLFVLEESISDNDQEVVDSGYENEDEDISTTEEDESQGEWISVYVCGAVVEEGVYELENGSRIYQAIEAAGGVSAEGMESYLNLAQMLEDGQKIYVPTAQEVEEGYMDVGVATEESGKVNINLATKDVLMTLTGIGEAKAEAIISYRETYGLFASIEELQNVTGIKEGVYSAIADDIEV